MLLLILSMVPAADYSAFDQAPQVAKSAQVKAVYDPFGGVPDCHCPKCDCPAAREVGVPCRCGAQRHWTECNRPCCCGCQDSPGGFCGCGEVGEVGYVSGRRREERRAPLPDARRWQAYPAPALAAAPPPTRPYPMAGPVYRPAPRAARPMLLRPGGC